MSKELGKAGRCCYYHSYIYYKKEACLAVRKVAPILNLRCWKIPDLKSQVGRVLVLRKKTQDTDRPGSFQNIWRWEWVQRLNVSYFTTQSMVLRAAAFGSSRNLTEIRILDTTLTSWVTTAAWKDLPVTSMHTNIFESYQSSYQSWELPLSTSRELPVY